MSTKKPSASDQYLKPNPEALGKIDHIIVLMLENRSFDNLLGWLYDDEPPRDGQHFDGLSTEMSNPLANVDPDGVPFTETVFVRKNGEKGRGKRWSRKDAPPVNFTLPDVDPGEGFIDTNQQLYGNTTAPDLYPPEPSMDGFVNNYATAMLYGAYSFGDDPTDPREIMTTYTPEQTPVLSALAKGFAVCDAWHASVPSQTLPNRDFVHAATSSGQVNNKPRGICDAKTVFNLCAEAGQPWAVYSGTSDGKPFSLTRLIMSALHDTGFDPSFRPIEQFYKDAASGDLPGYVFLEPQLSGPGQNDQHPPADIRPGEQLIADVYHAVRHSPAWDQTLLVVTYDEHGGCYDHAPPPGNATPPTSESDAGQHGFRFNRFGVRVPTVLISPWIPAGTVARPAGYTPFDHTSIIATVTNRFGLDGPLTNRDKAAPDLSCVLTLDEPRSDTIEVEPLDFDPTAVESINDLHEIIAETLANLTGVPSDPDDLINYIHDVYESHFGRST